MGGLLDAWRKALRDLMRPKVLAMVLIPIVCAMGLWLVIGSLAWGPLTQWINGLLLSTGAGRWIAEWSPGMAALLNAIAALAVLAPGVLITAMLITEFFTMPGLVKYVAQRDYPSLVPQHGGTAAMGIANSVAGIIKFVLLWLLTLPLWFTGMGALVVPIVSSAYLNQRLFRHDALAEHANREELRALGHANRWRLLVLALLPAAALYVPLFNLLVPALTGLAFAHYQLGQLDRLRAQAKPALSA